MPQFIYKLWSMTWSKHSNITFFAFKYCSMKTIEENLEMDNFTQRWWINWNLVFRRWIQRKQKVVFYQLLNRCLPFCFNKKAFLCCVILGHSWWGNQCLWMTSIAYFICTSTFRTMLLIHRYDFPIKTSRKLIRLRILDPNPRAISS